MTITLSALQKQRYDTAANWTAEDPTLLAGEIGVESDTGKIKIGTGSTAWTSLSYSGLIPGSGVYPYSQLLMPSGTAGAPSISFDGDTNTGIYRTGADGLAISTNGTQRINIEADGDINIDSGGVFYDATNNRLAVGTTSPGATLDVAPDANRNLQVQGKGGTTYGLEIKNGTANSGGEFHVTAASNGGVVFNRGTTEMGRFDSNSRLLVGTSSNIGSQNVQVGTAQGTLGLYKFANNNDGGELTFATSRNASVGSHTIVNNNDFLGRVFFRGSDGSAFIRGAEIACQVDGTPGANDMPGRLVFSTTADGASSPTERMRILQNGATRFINCPSIYPATDNATTLGDNGFRYSAVWAANGTIQTSDQRAKTEITEANLGSDFIKSLRPVSYKWIEGGQRDTGERDEDNNYIYESVPGKRIHWGFIAQEVKQAADDAGVDFGGWVLTDKDDPDSQQALRYDQFIAPLTKALQEALEKIETLEAKVAALETP